jgi:hypothetical protein
MDIEDYIKKLLSGKKSKKDVVDQLYEKPMRDVKGDQTTFAYINPGFIQQCDLLFLPNDKGYVYALVLVDQGSRMCDAEPLKTKQPSDVIKAFKAIYKRKIF